MSFESDTLPSAHLGPLSPSATSLLAPSISGFLPFVPCDVLPKPADILGHTWLPNQQALVGIVGFAQCQSK